MIPSTIRREHVLEALARIDRDEVPRGRAARGYLLLHEGRAYPPKYTVALAAELATGSFLSSEEFGGGRETNAFLKRFLEIVRPVLPHRTEAEHRNAVLQLWLPMMFLGMLPRAFEDFGATETQNENWRKAYLQRYRNSAWAHHVNVIPHLQPCERMGARGYCINPKQL